MGVLQQLSRVNVLLGNKSGRDKLYKTMQYLLKLCLELAHMGSIENQWLPHIKRLSLRLSQARALFRYVCKLVHTVVQLLHSRSRL